MKKVKIGEVIKAAILSAFTIATALIWKDIIMEAIALFFDKKDQIIYEIITALIATFILIIAISIILKTEDEAEYIVKKIKDRRKKVVKS